MRITVKRLYNDGDTTLGALFVGGLLMGFTCEDEPREEKVVNETRIPAGTYRLGVRKGSPMGKRYDAKYQGHDGMLWLQDVKTHEWVYFHPGNDEGDTSGCILVGLTASAKSMTIGSSRDCYLEFYRLVRPLISKEVVHVVVADE